MVDVKEILKLSVQERLSLVEAIWDSFDEEVLNRHFPLPEEQQKEIERRLDRLEAGHSKLYTWDEVKQQAKNFK